MRRSRRISGVGIGVLASVLVGVASLGLGACGDEDDHRSVPHSVVITLQPEPLATIVAGCDTSLLESWYEVAGTLIQTFADESRQGVNNSPQGVIPVLTRLFNLRDAIVTRPTPECVVMVHNAIMLQIRATVEAYQWYSEGQISQADLREKVDAAATAIDTDIMSMLKNTRVGLDQQLYDLRATQQAAPPP